MSSWRLSWYDDSISWWSFHILNTSSLSSVTWSTCRLSVRSHDTLIIMKSSGNFSSVSDIATLVKSSSELLPALLVPSITLMLVNPSFSAIWQAASIFSALAYICASIFLPSYSDSLMVFFSMMTAVASFMY